MDYYEQLELPPEATPEDIKRQYRKLALQYHPDRNPGKEAEVAPRFQAIGQAHEVLLDPEQRRKYDLSRQRPNQVNSFPRQTNTSRRRDPVPNPSAFEPPPRRNDPRYNQRRPEANRYGGVPPTANGTASGSGASRYTRFPNPPPPPNAANTSSKSEAKARANMYNAWASTRHGPKPSGQGGAFHPGEPPQPPPRRPAGPGPDLPPRDDIPTSGPFGRERPTSHERSNLSSRGRPGYRVPPAFYDPTSPGSGGANTATESINASSGAAPNANHMPPPFYKAGAHPHQQQEDMRRRPHRSKSGEEVPFREGFNRFSTPYTANPYERTQVNGDSLRRSASTKDAPGWAREFARQKQEEARQSRPQSIGKASGRSRTRSRPSSVHSGVEVEEEVSSTDDSESYEEGMKHDGAQPPFQDHAQQNNTSQQEQTQAPEEESPPPDNMDVDPPPAVGLDDMQDMSRDLPKTSVKAQTQQQVNGEGGAFADMSQMASELPNKPLYSAFQNNLAYRNNFAQANSNSDLPSPPKAPEPPHALTRQSWSNYLTQFGSYMKAWNEFNGRIVSHFQDSALRTQDRMNGPAGGMVEGWLGAVGATENLGDWQNYCESVRNDERVRVVWNVACERHDEAIDKHGRIRNRVLQGELTN